MGSVLCSSDISKLCCVLALAVFVGGMVPAFGAPPATVTIHGQLLDSQGHALTGARDYRIRFYNAAIGGSQLGSADLTGSTDLSAEGLFNISVVLPADVLSSAVGAWYETALDSDDVPNGVDANDVFPNRVKVESVPFSMQTQEALHVEAVGVGDGNVDNTEFAALAGVNGGIQNQLDGKANSADVNTSQAAQDAVIAGKANSADVYTKADVDTSQAAQDAVIAGKANSGDVYTKADVDTSQAIQDAVIAAKANSVDVYSKTDVDSSQAAQDAVIADKANAADVYDKTTSDGRYLQGELDTLASVTGRGASTDDLVTLGGGVQVDTVNEKTLDNGVSIDGVKAQDGFVELARISPPLRVEDRLYNVGGTAFFGGNPLGYLYPWSEETGTSVQSEPNHGYIISSATLCTVTLPQSTDLAVGDTVRVNVVGQGGCVIAQNANQWVRVQGLQRWDYGGAWTAQESNRYWQSVASSSDGTKLVACDRGPGYIYTSTNSGETWTARDSQRGWFGVASSSDGTKLVACERYDGYLYTSTDSGVTWTPRESIRSWTGVASSSNGTKLVACVYSGQLYTSINSGATWTARESDRQWTGVASASDGIKLVACVQDGQLYTSTISGLTWTARESNRPWLGVASSSDGTRLVAWVAGSQLHTSIDSGVSWTARESNRAWTGVASSSDGTKLIACVHGGQLYISTDSGLTWLPCNFNREWLCVASSSDGAKLVAGVNQGLLYTYSACATQTTPGVAGQITVDDGHALELQYVGNNMFTVISHEGTAFGVQ